MSVRRPVSPPRSSTLACDSPASGFPTGFVAGSQHCADRRHRLDLNTQFAGDRFHSKRGESHTWRLRADLSLSRQSDALSAFSDHAIWRTPGQFRHGS